MSKTRDQGTKQSWKRAANLAKLADGLAPGSERSSKARAFLAKNKEYSGLLDGKADKRNPKIREILEAYKEFLETPQTPKERRTSKGDPDQPVRAGAPTKRQYTKRGGRPKLKPGEVAIDALTTLRKLQRHAGLTTTELAFHVSVLGDLVDEPLDPKEFLAKVKSAARCRIE
jgi:hypothetical protein